MVDFPAGLDLKQLIIVHRHGERSPVQFVLDQYFEPNVWEQCSLNVSFNIVVVVIITYNLFLLVALPFRTTKFIWNQSQSSYF